VICPFQGGNPSSLVEAMRRKVVAWKPEAGFCLGEGANATTTGCTVPDEVPSPLQRSSALSLPPWCMSFDTS